MSDSNNRGSYGYGTGQGGGGNSSGWRDLGADSNGSPVSRGSGGFMGMGMKRLWGAGGGSWSSAPPQSPTKNINNSNNNGSGNNGNCNNGTQKVPSSSNNPPPQQQKKDWSRYQPTVEDVPDEDDVIDRNSSSSWVSSTEMDTGSFKTSMPSGETGSGGNGSQNEGKKDNQAKQEEVRQKPKKDATRQQHQSRPAMAEKKSSGKKEPAPKSAQTPTTPDKEKKSEIPEMDPRERRAYATTYSSPKPEQVARIPTGLNTTPGSSNMEGKTRRPYSCQPSKESKESKESPVSDTAPEIIGDRIRTPYAAVNLERTKSSTSPTEIRDDPILTANVRTPAPYSQTYYNKTPPPATSSQRKPSYRYPQEDPTTPTPTSTGRKSSQYSYIPPKSNPTSETTSTPKRQPSKSRTEAPNSRASTPGGGPRTPNPQRTDSTYDDPIISKIKEAGERRSPAPYAYTPPGSISSGTAPKMQTSYSQGSYSQIPPNLQSSGNLKRTSSPAALFNNTGSAWYPPLSTSPKPTPPHGSTNSSPAAATGGYHPPLAPDPGDYPHVGPADHVYNYQYQQSPLSYAPPPPPPAQPIWVSETQPGPPCPESTPIPWGTWYHPPFAPKFTICEGCFKKYILPTPFAPHFNKIEAPKSPLNGLPAQKPVLRACMFHSNLTKQLWQTMCHTQALQQQRDRYYQQNASVFYSYAQKRGDLIPCVGPPGIKPPLNYEQQSHWPRWWMCPELPSFLICEACFADYLDSTICIPLEKIGFLPQNACISPYVRFFQPFTIEMYLRQNKTTVGGELPSWVCDVGSNMLVKHLLEEANAQPASGLLPGNWDYFVKMAAWRLIEAKPCPGNMTNEHSAQALILSGGRRWYQCTRRLSKDADLMVCETCYYDMIFPAGLNHEFTDMWVSGHEIQPQCHLSMMEYRFPLSMAKEAKTYDIFWGAAEWGLHFRPCNDRGYILGDPNTVRTGILGGVEWYVLFDGPDEDADVLMECCPRCFHTYIKPSTYGDRFDRVLPGGLLHRTTSTVQTSTVLERIRFRICDLISQPHARFQKMFFKLLEATHQRDLFLLVAWLRASARLTPCARDGVIYRPSAGSGGTGGQRWYSSPGDDVRETITACEECYHGLINDTPLEDYFDDITEGIVAHLCDSALGHGPENETVLLCSLYSTSQRERLERCLIDLKQNPDMLIEDAVEELQEASSRRYNAYMDMREQMRTLEDEKMAVMHAQRAGIRLDRDPWGPGGDARLRDMEARVAQLKARWKELE